MKKKIAATALVSTFLLAGTVYAGGKEWNFQEPPYDFTFGNHIDTHQHTKVLPSGELKGFLYVEFTGEYNEDGYPIAKHTDCFDEMAECTVGWTLTGIQGHATFVYHESGDHPLWQVHSRSDIPQPGAYSHFHWLDDPPMAGMLESGEMLHGYFLELKAKDTFVFKHGNDEILVTPGLDLATHLNLVTVFPDITDTGTGGDTGGDDGGHTHE